jgi:hypothetical protein
VPDLLTDALPPVPIKDQIAEIEREVALRRRVYTAWVQAGRLKQSVADEQLRRMEAALATLKGLAGETEARPGGRS